MYNSINAVVFGFVGYALVVWFGGWGLAAGLFLAQFGNNISQSIVREQEKRK